MRPVKQVERNIIDSFGLAKNDIMRLKNEILALSQAQQKMVKIMDELRKNNAAIVARLRDTELRVVELAAKRVVVRAKPKKPKKKAKKPAKKEAKKVVKKTAKKAAKKVRRAKTKVVRKVVVKRPKKVFVGAKGGKKFHIRACPFAQNIMPKNRITFKSKAPFLNKGYKPCDCV